MDLEFSSTAPKGSKERLEELLFFNPRQHRVREGIVQSLAKYGHPRLVETETGLTVRVGSEEAQTLFVFDRRQGIEPPVGVVVFIRPSESDIVIVHVAVHPAYALGGRDAGTGLGIILIEKVKSIAMSIVGVRRVVFFYRQEVVINLTSAPNREAMTMTKVDVIPGEDAHSKGLPRP